MRRRPSSRPGFESHQDTKQVAASVGIFTVHATATAAMAAGTAGPATRTRGSSQVASCAPVRDGNLTVYDPSTVP